MSDYSWIPALAGAVGKGVNSYATAGTASAQSQAAYQQMLDNLRARFAEYDQLPAAGYQDIAAQQLGPSALDSIQVDPQGRQGQQEAIAALDDLAKNGGLSLSDLKALNEVQANLNRGVLARRQGLANDFAARGQLGSGAQLAMDLSGQQQAAESANERGESVAAQAQQRAMQAMLQKAGLSRNMTNDDYGRKAAAAQAADMIAARNAAARTDASKYNNQLRGQTYDDGMAKLKGKTALTGDLNEVVFGKGKNQANTTLAMGGYGNDLIDQAGTAGSKWGKSLGKSDTQAAGDDAFNSSDDSSNDDDDTWNNGD